jgi:hypothetical protein
MPSPFFSQNMAKLREVFPLLADELDKVEDGEAVLKIETAASGAPTLVFQGLYVHSKRDPEREAERLVGSAGDAGDEEAALVLGFGLGYAAVALAAKFPARPIIIVEKRPELLKKALEVRDLRTLLTRERLVFVLGGDGGGVTDALSLFESSPGVPPLTIWNRTLTGMDEEWYAGVEDRIRTWNSRTKVNRATQKRFGKRWVRNLSKNLEIVRDVPGISGLEGILRERDVPVFLAAAGPTLDDVGPFLNEISKRCLVVAVDTSLRFLLAHSVDPDFVVSVDPQYWNFRHLVPASKTRLVAESAVYPPCLRFPFEGIFLCGSLFPLGRFIEDRVDPKGDLGAGGSVATSAWDFVRLLGPRNVWIAGLDLAFPELKTHFHGAFFEEKSLAESSRFSTVETWNFRLLMDGQPFLAKQRGGGAILTDKRLSLYAAWFESRFNLFPELKNYSLSAEGLELKGLETRTLEELLALPERREELNHLLIEACKAIERDFFSVEAGKLRTEKYENAKKNLVDGLESIKNLAIDAASCAGTAAIRNRMGHLGDGEREKALKKLDAANVSITKSAVKEIAGFLFPETEEWEAEIAIKKPDTLTMHLEFSERFYKALSEAAAYNLRFLAKVPQSKADIFTIGRETPH